MKKIQEFSFPNSLIRTLIKEVNDDINLQKGTDEFLSKCAVLTVSFFGVILKDRKNQNEEEVFEEIINGLGINSGLNQ